jgi:hypothetical protein
MPNLECKDFLKKYINNYTCKHINPPRRGKMKPRGDYVYTIKYIIRCFVAYVESYPTQTIIVNNYCLLPQVTWTRTSATARCLQILQMQHSFLHKTRWFHITIYIYARLVRKEHKMHHIRPNWSTKRTSNVEEKSSKKLLAEPSAWQSGHSKKSEP